MLRKNVVLDMQFLLSRVYNVPNKSYCSLSPIFLVNLNLNYPCHYQTTSWVGIVWALLTKH
jgi:hypothetical protein